MNIISHTLCFIVCHTSAAQHFAEFARILSENQISYTVITEEQQKPYFDAYNISTIPFSHDLDSVLSVCKNAQIIITDVGCSFHIALHEKLSESGHKNHFAYYDNPESFVPGNYSQVAQKVMQAASGVLFANETFVKECPFSLEGKALYGIGYYTWMKKKEIIRELREKIHENLKQRYLEAHYVYPQCKKVIVYFGGNNDVYYNLALPAMLSHFSKALSSLDLHDTLLILQQHPGTRNNPAARDRFLWDLTRQNLLENPNTPIFRISEESTDDLLLIADHVCYYQTSISPLFKGAGLSFFQIGHEPYKEAMVRYNTCPVVTSSEELIEFFRNPPQYDEISWVSALGANEDWHKNLLRFATLLKDPAVVSIAVKD